MSRPNREFKLADDDGSTNDFIANIAKSAPKKKQTESPTTVVDRPANSEPWTSDIYTRLNGDGDSRRAQGHNCSSVIVFGFSVLLMLGGAGLIVVAAIQKSQKLLPVCPACDKTTIAMYAGGAFVIFVGLVGILAAKTRSKALAIPFCGLLSIIGLAFLALSILVVVFITNTNGLHLEAAWISEAKDDPESICQLQHDWECSGYTVCCNGIVTNESATTTITDAPTTTTEVSTTVLIPSSTEATATESTAAPTELPTESTAAPTELPTESTAAPTEPPTESTVAPVTVEPSTTEVVPPVAKAFAGADDTNVTTTEVTITESPITTTTTTDSPTGGSCFISTNGLLPAAVVDQCIPGCANNQFQRTCDVALHDKLQDNLAIILAVLIPAFVLIMLMNVFAIRMTRVDRYLE